MLRTIGARVWLAGGLGLVLIAALYHNGGVPSFSQSNGYQSFWGASSGSCDPTAGPGYVGQDGYFKSSTGCSSHMLHHQLSTLPEEEWAQALPGLKNQTILLYGDSVCRGLWDEICALIKAPKEQSLDPDWERPDYQEVFHCTSPHLGLKVIMYFQFGFVDHNKPEVTDIITNHLWPMPPWTFESRLPRRLVPFMMDNPPDLILLGGGAWDFKIWDTRDLIEQTHHHEIPQHDIMEVQNRWEYLVSQVREYFPKSKHIWLHVQHMNNHDRLLKHAWNDKWLEAPIKPKTEDDERYPPLLTPKRMTQYASAIRVVADKDGIDTLDYWKLADSFDVDEYSPLEDVVHPAKAPRIALVDMFLEKIHRWSQERV